MASRWAVAAVSRWRQCFTAKTSVTSNDATVWHHSVVQSSAAAHSFPLLGVSAAAAAVIAATTVSSNSDNDLVVIDKECCNRRFSMIDAPWNNRVSAARHWGDLCSLSLPALSSGRTTLTRCDESSVPQRQIPVKLQRKVRMYDAIVSGSGL
jgi:hypothetical protein